jgi:hypothetical protein
MPIFDYVVSRGVFEHINGGIDLARRTRWRQRLIFDVPYKEVSVGNPHHLITGITEKDFSKFPDAELFYQDLDGVIYDKKNKPSAPNMIICIYSAKSLPKVGQKIKFPVLSWQPWLIKLFSKNAKE